MILEKWVPRSVQLERVDVCVSLHSCHMRVSYLDQIVTEDDIVYNIKISSVNITSNLVSRIK